MLELQRKGVPAGAVQDAHDVMRVDPQLAHRRHWVRLPHAEMGESIYNNLPFRFSRTPVRPTRPAPMLGEHTREILHELLGLPDRGDRRARVRTGAEVGDAAMQATYEEQGNAFAA